VADTTSEASEGRETLNTAGLATALQSLAAGEKVPGLLNLLAQTALLLISKGARQVRNGNQ
jgi:hypothetical protein